MVRIHDQAAWTIEDQYPEVRDFLGYLGLLLPYTLTNSMTAYHAALVLGVSNPAKPKDWDMQIPAADFEDAVILTGASVKRDFPFDLPTGDNKRMRFRADDAHARIGEETIQFMNVHGPVCIYDQHGEAYFDTSFTDEAYAASEQYGDALRIAHPADTLSLYGLRQAIGGEGANEKHDLKRSALVIAANGPSPDAYTDLRSKQVGWDDRLWAFHDTAAQMAADLQRQPVAA